MNILTTEPEVKDCAYLPQGLEKVRQIKTRKTTSELVCEVDGGFTPENTGDAVVVGSDIVVSGRGIFMNGKIEENIRKMKMG